MNVDAVIPALRAAGLIPVLVEPNVEQYTDVSWLLRGTLDEFVEVVKAIGDRVVFYEYSSITEASFLGDATGGQEAEALATVLPSIEEYRDRIGLQGQVSIFFPYRTWFLAYIVQEPWYSTFIETLTAARVALLQLHNRLAQELETAETFLEEQVLSTLRGLVDNDAFVALAISSAAQRRLLAMAQQLVPALEELEPSVVAAEVQALRYRLQNERALGSG